MPRFVSADFGSLAALDFGSLRVAFTIGVLHRLSDETTSSLLAYVRKALIPGGLRVDRAWFRS